MQAYLDNSATTPVTMSVANKIQEIFIKDFGNPSSLHMKGVEAEKHLKEAKEILAKLLKVTPKEIIFTSCGTESNNLAIVGAAMANRRTGKKILTTQVEHASVKEPMLFLKEQGFDVVFLPVDDRGVVQLDALRKELDEETILVSIMMVNNVIGTRQPVEEVASIIKESGSKALFHVDAIQAFGKYEIHPKRMGIDLLSISGHKFHGPKGSGVLFVKEKTKIKPLMLGGGQQNGMRSGTDNVPGSAGLAWAAKECYECLEDNTNHYMLCKKLLLDGLKNMDDVVINSPIDETGAMHIVNASFLGVRSEVLLHALEDVGVYVSSGSACSSNKPGKEGTLDAIGCDRDRADSAIRFSFSDLTTTKEIEYTLEQLNKLLPVLRKYSRH
ncbi:cysteine desulfurase family protein [Eubacterium oxidoreducens]|uniref:cysteine desulfurase n=1 Tax=Eubacterium oxidoreducens TaxID=1732 RepID=A0A1G6BGE4_EUBOX|nr:cysteine desulfurase family protein [Eubacterium oxidoreducens]SDB19629.1 cysteine desulfurase [Eubacterium oxidoreducens]